MKSWSEDIQNLSNRVIAQRVTP